MSDNTPTAEPAKPAKRKARTIEERQAALEAELAELRSKAKAKDLQKQKILNEKLGKIDAQLRELQAKRVVLIGEIGEVERRLEEHDGELNV